MFLLQDRSLIMQTEGIEEVNAKTIINLFYRIFVEGLCISNFKKISHYF